MLRLGIGSVYVQDGKAGIDKRLGGYNNAAKYGHWFVLRDLDVDAPCAPELLAKLLPSPSPCMCFRVAVRAVESWLLADATAIAKFLKVPRHRVQGSPDDLQNPKAALVRLASYSGSRSIRAAVVPEQGTTAPVGPGYLATIVEYARSMWDPAAAATASPSLASCIAALRRCAAHGSKRR